jgi:two-component system NarL family sensor kinase
MDERHVYMIVALFLLFGLWMYTMNTVKIRQMALTKERLRTRVQTLAHSAALVEEVEDLEAANETSHPRLFAFLRTIQQLQYHDEYVFVLDTEGRTWADSSSDALQKARHPRATAPQDALDKLLQKATQGGGFVNYEWKHPTKGDISPKLSYVMVLGAMPFVLGCGTYT